MKKILSFFLIICMLFSFSACSVQDSQSPSEQASPAKLNYPDNLKAVWLSYYEIGELLDDLNETQAAEKLDAEFAALSEKGINTVFFHARAFADAFYKSEYFPFSKYCSSDYDTLQLALSAAHKYKLSFHAWVNPYRVALNTSIDKLPASSPALELYKSDPANLILTDGSVFLNPASSSAQKLILNGIREIVKNYDVDGVHFDDYFYPSAEKGIDKTTYAAYKDSGGKLNLADFRRENINALICSVYTAVKAENPNILFGVSPQCSIEKNYDSIFADVESWLDGEYLDYIMPQVYFGFENETSPFEKSVDNWVSFMKGKKAKLYCGLALYKSGKTDEYASEDKDDDTSAYYEWLNNDDIIARQIDYLKSYNIGFSLYSYSSLMKPTDNSNLSAEVANLSEKLK